MLNNKLLAVCIIVLSTVSVQARNFVLTIGGGYSPSGNQVSLEKNVLLFNRVLDDYEDQIHQHDVFFADGNDKRRDLLVHDPDSLPRANQLMAEFFGSSRGLGLSFRNHEVPGVRNALKPQHVRNWFGKVGPEMKSGDSLFVYVTAHGGRSNDRNDVYNTSIAMWENSSLRMKEFTKLLDQLDPEVNVVVVMVQCYTGGFSRLVYREGDPEKGLSPQRRAGFYATVHDRPAAGCTPDVNEANYVEYSTYFWAAVSGVDRTGKEIEQPDYDEDGVISLEEAHAYTILNADTIDVPVKTSGEFLSYESKFGKDGDEKFLTNDPPFSRVLEIASPVQKVVLAKLSEKLKLSGEKRLVDAWEKTRTNNQTRGRRPSPSSAGGLKSKIASDLRRKWPGLVNVINPVSVELMTSRSDEFINAIEKHPSYERYRTEIDKQKRQRSATETKAQYERFLRVADNVILAENLRRMGDATRIKEYESILAAERAPLFGTRAEDSEPEPACP